MKILKINSINNGIAYINIEEIVSFIYDKDSNDTDIYLRNGTVFLVEHDVSARLAKLITAATNNNMLLFLE